MSLQGKVAMVTGAAQGIGRAICRRMASEGADLALCDVNLQGVEEVAKELSPQGGKYLALRADVASAQQVEEMVRKALEAWGRVDILVNNAGITRDSLLVRMRDEDWDRVLDVNLKGAFYCTREVLRPMMRQRQGRIINVASVVGAMGNAGQANYVSSKAGLIGLTKATAREMAGRGITANAVAPGFIETEMTQRLSEEVRQSMLKQIPLARFGLPEDVAAVVSFLASEGSSYITGQVIHINGGMYM
ncbi:MAG: 3-oxoacyl-[acyl-carrier-protein] reductase [candidate division NC10 bacterium]|nr:3-oxoacyl-[acyl-carrier-protein] reductase [candidate division NC10 bacterium]